MKEFLLKSLAIELLSTSLVENKVEIRILPLMYDEIRPGKYN